MHCWGTATYVHLIVAACQTRARARARGPLKRRFQVCGDHSLRNLQRVFRVSSSIMQQWAPALEFRANYGRNRGRISSGAFLDLLADQTDGSDCLRRNLSAAIERAQSKIPYRVLRFYDARRLDASRARAHNDSILIRRELVSLLARALEFRSVSARSFNIALGTANGNRGQISGRRRE